MTTPTPTMTATELSKHLRISRNTLYKWIEKGLFPVEPIKGTNPRRWHVEAVNEWMKSA